jgi:hypothetical protein
LPSLQVLVALHGFWCLMLAPPTLWAVRHMSGVRLQQVGKMTLALAGISLATVLGWGVWSWLGEAGSHAQYILPRLLFLLAVQVHVPLPHLCIAAAVCWRAGRRRS